jgi:hypothetical protein
MGCWDAFCCICGNSCRQLDNYNEDEFLQVMSNKEYKELIKKSKWLKNDRKLSRIVIRTNATVSKQKKKKTGFCSEGLAQPKFPRSETLSETMMANDPSLPENAYRPRVHGPASTKP